MSQQISGAVSPLISAQCGLQNISVLQWEAERTHMNILPDAHQLTSITACKDKHTYIRKHTHAHIILNLLTNTVSPLNTCTLMHTPSDVPTHWGQQFGHRQHSILLLRLQWKNLLFDPEYFQHFQQEGGSQGMPCFSAKREREEGWIDAHHLYRVFLV